MKRFKLLAGCSALAVMLGFSSAASPVLAQEEEVPFDVELNRVLQDGDGDSYPDVTEGLEGTDPQDAADFPGAQEPLLDQEDAVLSAGFPASSCRPGFRQAGSRLCISRRPHSARTFLEADTFCRDRRSRVATHGDLRYLYVRTSLDSSYNPRGRWLGDFVGDDLILCGNRSITFNGDPDISNFEGRCNKRDRRTFWCAHDDG